MPFSNFKDALQHSFDDDIEYDDLNIESQFNAAVGSALKRIGVSDLDKLLEHHQLMRDALDHVKRICNSARQPTKRLDWVVARCKMALLGEQWDREYAPLPKHVRDHELEDMKIALAKSQKLLREHLPEVAKDQISENAKALSESPGIHYEGKNFIDDTLRYVREPNQAVEHKP